MEWTAVTIHRFRAVGLCLSQEKFAAALGFAKRTVGNAERGAHPPSLALRRALDDALEKASDAQRDRFLAAENEASDERTTPSATNPVRPGNEQQHTTNEAQRAEPAQRFPTGPALCAGSPLPSRGNDATDSSQPFTELAHLLLAHVAATSAGITGPLPGQEAHAHQLADYLRTWAADVNRRVLLSLLPAIPGGYPFAARTGSKATTGLDIHPVEHFQQMRKVLIDNDNTFGARSVVPLVQEQIAILQRLRQDYRGVDRQALLHVQTQFAELCGWLYQDSGDYQAAAYWSGRALEWAHMCGDHDAIAYILARKSHLAADKGDPGEAVDAAEAALTMAPRASGRVMTIATAFAAQGHALRRDRTNCERSYAMAHELFDRVETDQSCPWARIVDHSYIEVYRARSLTFLGEYGAAVDSFQQAISGLPHGYRRDRGVYLAREAVAHIGDDDVEQASTVGLQALAIGAETRSARIIGELKHLDAALGKFSSSSSAADFHDAMNT